MRRNRDVPLKGVLVALAALVGLIVTINVVPARAEPSQAARGGSAHPPVSVLSIVAGPGLAYDRRQYEVSAGTVRVRLTGLPGLGLTFADPRLRGCRLATDGPRSCTVDLTEGSYAVFDGIPSHRAAGVEATIFATPT